MSDTGRDRSAHDDNPEMEYRRGERINALGKQIYAVLVSCDPDGYFGVYREDHLVTVDARLDFQEIARRLLPVFERVRDSDSFCQTPDGPEKRSG